MLTRYRNPTTNTLPVSLFLFISGAIDVTATMMMYTYTPETRLPTPGQRGHSPQRHTAVGAAAPTTTDTENTVPQRANPTQTVHAHSRKRAQAQGQRLGTWTLVRPIMKLNHANGFPLVGTRALILRMQSTHLMIFFSFGYLSYHTTHTTRAERRAEKQCQRRGASSGQKTKRGI